MDIYSFIASLVGSLAWPIAATAIAFSQRTALSGFIGKIKNAKLLGAELGIGDQIEAVREQVEAVPAFPALPTPDSTVDQSKPEAEKLNLAAVKDSARYHATFIELSDELATNSAVGSIMASWIELENGLRQLADHHELPTTSAQSFKTIRNLYSAGFIPDQTYSVIQELRNIRNKVVHSASSDVTLEDARNFRASVREVLQKIGFDASANAWR